MNNQSSPNKPAEGIVRIRSESLLGEHGRLVIVHDGEEYLLRRTRLGKLILTK